MSSSKISVNPSGAESASSTGQMSASSYAEFTKMEQSTSPSRSRGRPNFEATSYLLRGLDGKNAVTGQVEYKSALNIKEDLRKHSRSSLGPEDKYEKPMTSSQEYGWGIAQAKGSPSKEGWAGRTASSITKYAENLIATGNA